MTIGLPVVFQWSTAEQTQPCQLGAALRERIPSGLPRLYYLGATQVCAIALEALEAGATIDVLDHILLHILQIVQPKAATELD